MKVYIANDHGGVELKNRIIAEYAPQGYEFINLGTDTTDIVRYPYYAEQVAKHVAAEEDARGILICSTGIGMSMAANKHRGIRAACCSDSFSAMATRLHNDANVLCFGARVVGESVAMTLVDAFINTEYEGGRHQARVDRITAIERGEL